MSDERWTRVRALFEAAVERPVDERSAFLAAETGGDEALIREVEALLLADQEASLFDRLPLASSGLGPDATSLEATRAHPLLGPRHRVGWYEIVALIGTGGMGEVYRTRDTKLNRDVALKVLPAEFAADPARLARFRREAQLLAALNHPNIAAIHGFEESSGVHALVLELVEGPTLADLITRGPLPLDRAITIARQIAEALEAAHEHGIVHRDLKPANIKVRSDGIVKVLDFGLAKALASDSVDSRPLNHTATREGIILGTAAYMSPEQAKGQAVDRRTDIWAFGCVLFEMLAGAPAFRGETMTELLAAVVKDEPDWALLPVDVPEALGALLRRCLTKDVRQRLQAIGEARIDVDALDKLRQSGFAVHAIGPAPAKPLLWWLPWVALASLAVAFIVREALRPAAVEENALANLQFTPFTNWEGTEGSAVISPDGRFVAFIADRAGELDIWLGQIGTGDIRNLTSEIAAMQPIGPIFRKLGFSGDGGEIWYTPQSGPAMAQMMIPLMGGAPRPFLDQNATAPSWSPDGTRIAYFKNEDGDPLFVADRNGADARQILIEPKMHHHNPVWSRDGEWIYFARGPEVTEGMDVWRVRPSGESLQRLTEQPSSVNFLAPLDTHTLLYIARAPDGSGPWLWALDVERKQTRRVTTGLGHYTSVSASRDGRRVAATVATPTATLWQVPLLDRAAGEDAVQPFRLPTTRALAPRFAGATLFYLSSRGTTDGLWQFANGQSSEVLKGDAAALSEPPAVSPDGTRAAVVVRRDRRRHLIVVAADGRSSRTLVPSEGVQLEIEGAAGQSAADWSPDGAWIVIGGRDAKGAGLFKIPVDGGRAERIVSGAAANPVWSPKGDLILYGGRFFTGQVELGAVRPDGVPVQIPTIRARPGGYRFLRDGTGLVYLEFIPSLDFSLFDFATNSSRQLTRLENHGALGTFDLSADGKSIIFDRSRENSDIVLIDVPR